MNDLTILYYTANEEPEFFLNNTKRVLLEAVGDTPIVSVSFKPTIVGDNCTNIVVGEGNRSNYKLYKQILIAAKEAKTDFVATAEDDMLYSKEHFQYRPGVDIFAYNTNKWSIFSWVNPPIFSFRIRKLMSSLIVRREALVKTLEERYAKYPTIELAEESVYPLYWGEPGRFEDHLFIEKLKSEEYQPTIPNVMFSTEEALGYLSLGNRKAHSKVLSDEIPYWGKASDVLKFYKS